MGKYKAGDWVWLKPTAWPLRPQYEYMFKSSSTYPVDRNKLYRVKDNDCFALADVGGYETLYIDESEVYG